jgi:hypothetical protein
MTGNCLDSNLAYKGNILHTYKCDHGTSSERFLTPAGLSQSFWITNFNQLRHGSGYCADGSEGETEPVKLKYCRTTVKGQQWDIERPQTTGGNLYFQLRNRATGLCLDIALNPDETLRSANCSSSCSQRWRASYSAIPLLPPPKPKPFSGNKRLLCWVMTQPKALASKAEAVASTWGSQCDKLLFVSSEPHPGLNVLVVDVAKQDARTVVWAKTQKAWMHVYDTYRDQADWFLRAEDDTCILMVRLFYSCAQS